MIYDAFLFFNELELLELRLHELSDVVDRFVLVEATRTFSGETKPLYFSENQARFAPFLGRIEHIVVDDEPAVVKQAWDRENHQRNAIERGLRACRPDDIVLISDVDEIPSPLAVRQLAGLPYREDIVTNLAHRLLQQRRIHRVLRRQLKKCHPYIWVFDHRVANYFLNFVFRDGHCSKGTRLVRFRDFTTARDIRRYGGRIIRDAGWHFSFLGDVERVQRKVRSYSHQEFNNETCLNAQRLAERRARGVAPLGGDEPVLEAVPLDESFPRYLRRNPGRFLELIAPVKPPVCAASAPQMASPP